MGDRRRRALHVQFDGKLKLEFHGTKITSDAGLLAFRELDEAFRLHCRQSVRFVNCPHNRQRQLAIKPTPPSGAELPGRATPGPSASAVR